MSLEFKKIISLEQDIAGKWRALVDVDDETIMLKFQTKPTLQTVKKEASQFINNKVIENDIIKETELENIKNEITRLQDRKAELESKE